MFVAVCISITAKLNESSETEITIVSNSKSISLDQSNIKELLITEGRCHVIVDENGSIVGLADIRLTYLKPDHSIDAYFTCCSSAGFELLHLLFESRYLVRILERVFTQFANLDRKIAVSSIHWGEPAVDSIRAFFWELSGK